MKENKIMIHVLVTADLNCPRKADRIKKKGKDCSILLEL